ncbi:DUF1963 domain-containing protein [Streptomyces brasiliscabiei]|uniref:DUF1963 domain-containing protein n=1 Tax=Streptomyces brasiliscabiei TaxID=2736302 RepID=A0ABU8G378_9ACTN
MTAEHHTRTAAEHLPGELAQGWTALLRPCVRLRRAADTTETTDGADTTETTDGADERIVAVLGGVPELPVGTVRPEWPGHGPLSFVAAVRCAELPRDGLADEFPWEGTPLFLYSDGQADEEAFVSVDDPETRAGARVLYVPEGTPVLPADTPPALEAFRRVELAVDTGRSAPDLWLPQARRALLGDHRHWPHPRDTPAELKPFVRAFGTTRTRIGHQIGGHAVPSRARWSTRSRTRHSAEPMRGAISRWTRKPNAGSCSPSSAATAPPA